MKRSIATHLVALFVLAALLTFTLVGAALYGVLRHELERHQDEALDSQLQSLRYSIEHANTLARWQYVVERMEVLAPAGGRVRAWVLSDDPRFQFGRDLADAERLRHAIGRDRLNLPGHADPLDTLSAMLPAAGERPAVQLIVASDAAAYHQTLRMFLAALLVVGFVALAFVALAGGWIARRGLQPLARLSQEAGRLRPRVLSQRLQSDCMPDELSTLAQAFNGALARLEEAYRQLEAFNADVAHELRTPLANMIGGTQVALARPRAAPEYEEALQSNLEEMERLRSIVNDMLFLARADQGEAATGLVRAVVGDEVRNTIEFFEFVLDEASKTVTIAGDTRVEARVATALLRRALSNLLQNAIEHSPPQARIEVQIVHEAPWVWLRVCNSGTPVAPVHLPRLFDRFYRVDVSRNTGDDHRFHGLGLAIVKAVAHMHGGSVSASSDEQATCIGFSVPAATDGTADERD